MGKTRSYPLVILLSMVMLFANIVIIIPFAEGTSDYEDQPLDYYSIVPTINKWENISDAGLAYFIKTYIGSNYKNMIFVFGQCKSGGFIDDLASATSGLNPIAIMSASKHNEDSYGTAGPDITGESCFLMEFKNAVRKDSTRTIKQLFDEAEKNDGADDHPQFCAQPQPAGDNIKLHDGTSNYAILYAGRPNRYSYWNDLEYMYNTLRDLGYTDNDIFVLYGNKKLPDGTVPSWPPIDYEATDKNLETVFQTLQGKMGPTETLFFWVSNHGGGQRAILYDPVPIPPGQTLLCSFSLTSDFIADLHATVDPPYVKLSWDGGFAYNPVFLNGYLIGYLSATGYYHLEFDAAAVPLYEVGNEIKIHSMEEHITSIVSDIYLCADVVPEKEWVGGVGGIVIPVDKFGLLAPYIGLASTVIVAAVATAIYVKRVKRRKEKQ
jgi:hypothetical protein